MSQILNNRYQVVKALSSGGFGETFLAEDTHLPSRGFCVIKQLKPVNNDTQTCQLIQERFAREAAVLETLSKSSRQIPRLYAYFNEAEKFYLVQEWVEGKTVAELVQQTGALKESTVIQILINLLQTLEKVHAQHIVHRDIKPENIILRSEDFQPVLIDFGAVKEMMQPVNEKGSKSSIVIGTPGFIPLEQSAGYPLFASDLYSLGLTAIYMLCGKSPQEIGMDVQTRQIEWRSYCPGISQALAAVINRSIQLHPSERYTSAREMLLALEPIKSVGENKKTTGMKTTQVSTKNQNSQADVVTIISESRTSRFAGLWQFKDWTKMVVVGGLLVGVPTIMLSNLGGEESQPKSQKTHQPQSLPSAKPVTSSIAATKQENAKKLLATKAYNKCDLSGIKLTNADLSNASLMYANLSGADLSGADLTKASLSNSNLEKANFNGANLTRANLGKAVLKNANLSGANLTQAYMLTADLNNASLTGANLTKARLNSADFTGANLTNVLLKKAYLGHSNFSKAQLVGANFTGADMCGFKQSNCADFTDANLKGAIGIKSVATLAER